jgi:hypothetical protein
MIQNLLDHDRQNFRTAVMNNEKGCDETVQTSVHSSLSFGSIRARDASNCLAVQDMRIVLCRLHILSEANGDMVACTRYCEQQYR